MELCLGTVQFGMDYGICGQKQPSLEQASSMLDYAIHNGVKHIDTAKQYGTAEDVVGFFLSQNKACRSDIFLSTKLQPNRLDSVKEESYYEVCRAEIECQLKRLHTDYVDAYLLHSARYVYSDAILDALQRLKKDGYARYVGVSVYETAEAEHGIESNLVDYLQLPYSIFDQRMQREGVFEAAGEKNTIIDTRSAFIQGLLLMKKEQVPPFLMKAKPILEELNVLSQEYGISKIALAMNYVKEQSAIQALVFGVDNIEQLREDIQAFQTDVDKKIMRDIAQRFSHLDADIVMPSLWKK